MDLLRKSFSFVYEIGDETLVQERYPVTITDRQTAFDAIQYMIELYNTNMDALKIATDVFIDITEKTSIARDLAYMKLNKTSLEDIYEARQEQLKILEEYYQWYHKKTRCIEADKMLKALVVHKERILKLYNAEKASEQTFDDEAIRVDSQAKEFGKDLVIMRRYLENTKKYLTEMIREYNIGKKFTKQEIPQYRFTYIEVPKYFDIFKSTLCPYRFPELKFVPPLHSKTKPHYSECTYSDYLDEV